MLMRVTCKIRLIWMIYDGNRTAILGRGGSRAKARSTVRSMGKVSARDVQGPDPGLDGECGGWGEIINRLIV